MLTASKAALLSANMQENVLMSKKRPVMRLVSIQNSSILITFELKGD